jgi:hypothetical protein
MADEKLTAIRTSSPFVSPLAAADLIYLVQDTATTPDQRAITASELSDELNVTTRYLSGSISNPQAAYAQRPQVFLFQAPFALTITRIHISGPDATPGAELAGDLKFADDTFTGVFANATVIDVCDTTSGVFTATSFDDATVPANKYIYFSMDASPNADWKDIYIRIDYTVD